MSTQFDIQSLFEFSDIPKSTKEHLVRVYGTLTMLTSACVLGAFLSVAYQIGNVGCSLLGILCLLYIAFSDRKSPGRLVATGLFGVLEGLSIGPLVGIALEVDPQIIITALMGALGIFVSFSLAAFYSDRRSSFYLGGLLNTGIWVLLLMSILSFFGVKGEFVFNVQLYLGLAIFMGYVMFDTQMMIEKANRGQKDYVLDAINLFIDLVQIFVRILIILLKESSKKKSKD